MQKKTIFTAFLLLFCISSFAQDKKPTKEETVDYIKNTIINSTYNKTDSGDSYYRDFKKNYIDATLVDCLLKITYTSYSSMERKGDFGVRKTNDRVEIPVDKIEKIILENGNLKFFVFQNKKSINTESKGELKRDGISKIDDYESVSDYTLYANINDTDKLIKAFNNLRKLCGAPEPISFD